MNTARKPKYTKRLEPNIIRQATQNYLAFRRQHKTSQLSDDMKGIKKYPSYAFDR